MGIFNRGLAKTRKSFFGRIANMLGNTELDDETWDDIEALLIQADVGVETTGRIIKELRSRGITKDENLQVQLREVMASLLKVPPTLNISGRELSIMLVVGVNGSGKTTTIGKLAHRLHTINQRKVMLAAGDTFRAAAIEQLKMWGERVDVPVIASKPGADPAALVYDATAAAKARGYDVLIIDTAGRLHTNFNLMEELAKIRAVSEKIVPGSPHEVMLVLDGTTGQNALQQAQKFKEMIDVTGVIVTKLDSSAKGGMVFSVFNDLNLPVHYVGLGEGINDLVLFNPEIFVKSLFDEN
ncbi:MAG: signal recognition particle-docking protein FtsY [Phototrophicales bacterium]|mgnify:CR=1 FL=1|nr:signal recognition particle-docking protein FtsY [Phototrophicales bacterium]